MDGTGIAEPVKSGDLLRSGVGIADLLPDRLSQKASASLCSSNLLCLGLNGISDHRQ